MTQKKRIYDLAKEYGMSGQDLAKHLRDRGFSQIKGHMTALDDFQVLQIQGMLEAEGYTPITAHETAETADVSGGLILKKKKKKTLTGEPEPAAAPEEKAPELEAAAPLMEPQAPTREFEPEPEPEPTLEERVVPAPARRTHPRPATIEPEPEPAPRASPASTSGPSTPSADEALASVPTRAPAHEPAPERTLEPAARAATPPPMATAPVAVPAGEKAVSKSEMVEPATAKRLGPGGKIMGFIDLSKLVSSQPKKPMESRRLRSKDDVAPNVQPTLGHDKKRALLRGDRNARGTLTAGQLRERESSRFLRRSGPGQRGPGGPGGGGGPRGPRRDGSSSPHGGMTVTIGMPITVKKLAEALSVKINELITVAIQRLGMDLFKVNINSLLDEDTAVLLAHEYDVELDISKDIEAETELIDEILKRRKDIAGAELSLRPPTVAFLGHVDHGKTTLIDTIRNSRVAEGEAGGITQHVGAYQVKTKSGHTLTIIDTPGHAAFTAMRARGANAVDIVVLVVAADDGVMPSTEEALAHARAADVPIVVALTKMDKPEANPKKAMEQLGSLGVTPEEWGGPTAFIKVSALKKQGVDELLERVFLESEVLELMCHPEGPAQGVVLEAEVSEGKGIVAHVLVQDGTLQKGDVILAGEGYGKVRSMHDDRGQIVTTAPPSFPVEISGLQALPGIGESFYVVSELAAAKEVAEERARKNRAMSLVERRAVTAESLHKAVSDSKRHIINVVVRADVQGSVEVLKSSLSELKHEEVEVKVLHAGVGAVTESDILRASTTGATVIAFHTSVNDKARLASERENVEIRHYDIIYQLLDDTRALMEGVLAPEIVVELTGHVEVRALFKSSKVGTIAGSHVIDGSIFRDSRVRVQRGGAVLFDGLLASLRREKDDAKEVREGFDCGIVVKDYPDLQVGDVLEAYRTVKKKRTLGDRVPE